MTFKLTLLGTNSAFPSPERFATGQFLQVQNSYFLFDCGEGTQIRMQQYGLPAHRIGHIFISHLHGDHMLGLAGLLQTFALQQRSEDLEVYSPPGLEAIIQAHHREGSLDLPFSCRFHELDTATSGLLFADRILEVYRLPLLHRIPTCGYLLREKERQRNIRPEWIERYELEPPQIVQLKEGQDVQLPDGRRIRSLEATAAPEPSRSFAFCTDTAFCPGLVSQIKGVDLLYHEATFCSDQAERARRTGHSTAREAASIAREAGAGHLLLGHFSSRYQEMDCFEREARAVFPNVSLAVDGMVVELPWRPGEGEERIRIAYPDRG